MKSHNFFLSVFLISILFVNKIKTENDVSSTTVTSEVNTLIDTNRYFTIVGAATFRANSEYHISISLFNARQAAEIRVGIRGNITDTNQAYDNFKVATVQPGTTEVIPLQIVSVFPGDYKLYALGLSGIELDQETSINYNNKEFSVFVQTDKSVYKPGDNVQFRIIFLDANLKAAGLGAKRIEVFINDANSNRIKQWKNAKLVKGVFSGELQLSDDPNLGDWKINIEVGEEKSSKTFSVEEYVLPKFEVIIDSQRHATFKEGKIKATIRSKYTYGKLVKGEVTVSAFPTLYVGSLQPFESQIIRRKVLPLDGKATVEFTISDELGLRNDEERDIVIEAVVEEALTGRKQNGSGTITLHKSKYKMDITGETDKFKPGLSYIAWIKVKHHDGTPVQDKTNKVFVEYENIAIPTYYPYWRPYQTEVREMATTTSKPPAITQELTLNENGMAKFQIDDVNSTWERFSLKAKYLDINYDYFTVSKEKGDTGTFIQIKVLTQNPTVNKEVSLAVKSTQPLKSFTYQIYGRGDILVSNTVNVESEATTATFKFLVSFAMVPKAKIYVYYIDKSGEIVSDKKELNLPEMFQNPVKINLSKTQAKPGEDFNITVITKPNSYIGLLGVDESVLLLKKGNDLDQSHIFSSLKDYEVQSYRPYSSRGKRSFVEQYCFREILDNNLIILTNAKPRQEEYPPVYFAFASAAAGPPAFNMPAPLAGAAPIIADFNRVSIPKPQLVPFQVRKEFLETWLWQSLDDLGYEGQVTVNKKIPDTITSWIITGFAIDPITGFGMTQNPRKLEVFQPFFVSINLPYSIKRGEVVSIPIVVFNYMNEDVQADVTLDNTLLEFEFADVDEATNKSKPKVELYRTRRVVVISNNGASAAFMIRPKKTGYITIKVTAVSPIAGDGVERQLLVEPDGVANYVNKGFFIDLRETNEFEAEVEIKLPLNVVPDSTKIQFSVIGDILGPTIKNLDKLIKLPYGCGEQNMLNFVPNIVILEYLKNTNQVTDAIKSKSIKYMEKGYQRELTYKHADGSFSAFGSKDGRTPGSTWLTAFVAKSFRQAADYIEIDEKVVKKSLDWLFTKQATNGSFPEVGNVIHKDMQGGGGSGLALTAYVLTAFLQTQEDMTTYRNTIDKALDYILKHIETTDDIYSLAVTAYALQLVQHSSKTSVLQTLQSKSKDESGLIWWEKPIISKKEKKNPYYSDPSSVNVELTAYALLAYVEAGLISESIPILKWLISQRNEVGGFASTQDTVVGIGALAKIGAKLLSAENNVQVTAKHNEEESALNINAENAGVLQSRQIPPSVRKVMLKATGRGIGMAQVSYKYNVNVTGAWPRFTLDPQVNKNSNPDYLSLTICTSYIPNAEENDLVSNMAVMEVKFISGFTADLETLPSLERSFGVQKVQTKEDDTVVVMYFNNLDSIEICPTVTGFRTHKVANQKPAPVIIYDYYDNTRRARQFYHGPGSTLCDICESNDCIEKCAPKAELQKSDDGPSVLQSHGRNLASATAVTITSVLIQLILFK